LSFWHGSAGLSFVAFILHLCGVFNDVCVAASDGKMRYGPFVRFMSDGFIKVMKGVLCYE